MTRLQNIGKDVKICPSIHVKFLHGCRILCRTYWLELNVLPHPHGAWFLILFTFSHPHAFIYGIAARAPFLSPPSWSMLSDTLVFPTHIWPYMVCLLELNVWHRPHRAWFLKLPFGPAHIARCFWYYPLPRPDISIYSWWIDWMGFNVKATTATSDGSGITEDNFAHPLAL